MAVRKILVVARTEYLNAVRSKAFLVGLLLMPLMMGGAFLVQYLTQDQVDLRDHRFGVIDHSGQMFDVLEQAARRRHETEIYDTQDSGTRRQKAPRYIPERYPPFQPDGSRTDVLLSQLVREERLFAYVIIGQNPAASSPTTTGETLFAYHTNTPTYDDLPQWIEQTLNAELQRRRLIQYNLDPAVLASLMQRFPVKRLGLVKVNERGEVIEAEEENKLLTFGVPFAALILLYMIVMTSAPSLLNTVLEEKMQKISEFLVSSLPPFHLLLGKLLGSVGVALTLSALYLGAAYYTSVHYGVADRISPMVYVWFIIFELLALVMFGSIFSALGAACSEMRDAQSLMGPIMLLVMIPMFCLGPVLRAPDSSFSRAISLFPPATPMLMFLRIAVPPGPAWWELALGVALTVATALACVWAGGKIFRIGILSQGQAPTLGRLALWLISR